MKGVLNHRLLLTAVVGLALAGFARAQEKLPPGAKLASIEARPSAIELKHPFAYAQLLVTGKLDSGEQFDVTRLVRIEKPATVTITPTGLVRPTADGEGAIQLTLDGKSVNVPVKVSGQKEKHAV